MNEIISRNRRISDHLDVVHRMWREGKIATDEAKRIYKMLVSNIILFGHYDLFDDVELSVSTREYEDEYESKPSPRRRRFTDEDLETLKRLYARGKTAKEIGGAINRTTYTVQQVIARLQTQKVLPKRYKPRASASNININNNNEGK